LTSQFEAQPEKRSLLLRQETCIGQTSVQAKVKKPANGKF